VIGNELDRQIFKLRARLPIDGRLATRDSADRQRKSVSPTGFQLYAKQYIS